LRAGGLFPSAEGDATAARRMAPLAWVNRRSDGAMAAEAERPLHRYLAQPRAILPPRSPVYRHTAHGWPPACCGRHFIKTTKPSALRKVLHLNHNNLLRCERLFIISTTTFCAAKDTSPKQQESSALRKTLHYGHNKFHALRNVLRHIHNYLLRCGRYLTITTRVFYTVEDFSL
jgi:hypothetical protein